MPRVSIDCQATTIRVNSKAHAVAPSGHAKVPTQLRGCSFFAILLFALTCLIWSDRSRWINVACVISLIILAGFCVVGHHNNCDGCDDEQDERSIMRRELLQHGGDRGT